MNRCSNMPLLYLGRPRGRTSRAMTADSWNEATSGTLYHLSPVWMCLSWCHLSGVALTPVLSPFLATNAGEAGLLRHSSSAVCSRVIRVSFTAASSRSARTWGALVPNFQTTAAVRGRRRQALARAMRQDWTTCSSADEACELASSSLFSRHTTVFASSSRSDAVACDIAGLSAT